MLLDSLLGFLRPSPIRDAFSHRQKLIHAAVRDRLCDVEAGYGPDDEGNWRILTQYWLAATLDECEAITERVWTEMDAYFDARGETGDPLSPLAPFLIKALPAHEAGTA